ncbi:hypothetical protein [Mesorhizobium sp. B2-3-10]|uniref:phage replication initiation protein, NGO0469 family n=1 Tax=Mesorhizobium sp. B2-3-10 TaxID=2589954 RepID=UPI00112D7D91|nr:hypothetical protein [Mesorhizobium sp. B2-3-10]TPL94770.1 hypothetical protein FJ943_25130 [Mesorhizobium sp. B2-3-10]
MALLATRGGGDFQIAPQGQFAAICCQVLDLGHHFSEKYGKWSHKIRIVWELHGENQIGDGVALTEDGKPMSLGAEYTLSLSDNSNLRPFLEGWRGRPFTAEEEAGFDVSKLLGVPCMLTIQHAKSADGSKTYANPVSASPLLKSLQKPTQHNPSLLFELDPWNQQAFEALPDWLRERVKKSREYGERFGGNTPAPMAKPVTGDAPFDDEIPF